jgi:hypothetical protein
MTTQRLWLVRIEGSSTWVVRARNEGTALLKAINEDGVLLSSHIHGADVQEITETRG